ncbi:Lysosome membrane protein 2 [Echinococcus granulosus]|uniref:CD36 class B scavenger receptor n=1 Tax=Echinococcus granulosus TaxID=6210 RepID=A0A068WIS8_ECHGR|nr:Lysosome membrane protein 2 [Echinococcus granulosus]CDS18332.1 CD36 class B scavenger receptor [Echinococcus granulosus]
MKKGMIVGKSPRKCWIALLTLSCLVLLTTLGLATCELLFDTIESNLLVKELIITENSSGFQVLTTNSNNTVQFYLFNLTNAEEWQKNRKKPRLRAVGPYVYRRFIEKKDVRFREDICGRGVMEYSTSTVYQFEPKGSIGDPKKDRLVVPNFVECIANSMIKQAGSFATQLLWGFLSRPLLLDLTVDEVMWGHEYQNLLTGKVLGLVGDTKMGLFKQLNNSVKGPYQINTGFYNISKLGNLVAIKGKPRLDNWNSTYANMLNGTADAITPPSVKLGDRRYMFSADLCRSVPLIAKKWVSAKNLPELKLLSLEMDRKVFLSADEEPDNAAFHPKVYPTKKYPPTGLLSISPCVDFGISGDEPLFISLPFFNQAADAVKDAVVFEGPTEPNLMSHLHIDSKTGILLGGEFSFQINAFLAKDIQKTPEDIYFPLVYVKNVIHADRESAQKLYKAVHELPATIRRAVRALLGILVILAVLLLVAAVILRRREQRHLRDPSDDTWSLEDEKWGKSASL